MPVAEKIKSSWADEVELEGGTLPPSTEVRDNGFKIVTDYKYNDDDKKVKVVRTYKIEKRIVSKTIAQRKCWPKFGESKSDKPGPSPATTIVAEDVFMQYISSKEEEKNDEGGIEKLRASGKGNVLKCRNCHGDHFTTKCPFKDTQLVGGKPMDDKKGPTSGSTGLSSTSAPDSKPTGSKYVPPNLREGGAKRGDSSMQKRDDTAAIRISNLSESTTESDLGELVSEFGPIQKLFLAKDKVTGLCKSFAYIHFKFRNDAANAIASLNGHGYDHLILTADWSKPPSTNQ